jgi:hypothetical protein
MSIGAGISFTFFGVHLLFSPSPCKSLGGGFFPFQLIRCDLVTELFSFIPGGQKWLASSSSFEKYWMSGTSLFNYYLDKSDWLLGEGVDGIG